MYCKKCGRLKSECICNKNNEVENKSNKAAIITIVVVVSIIILSLILGLVFFSNSSKLATRNEASNNSNNFIYYEEKFYNLSDEESYILLHYDGTFEAKRNYCSGFEKINGYFRFKDDDIIELLYEGDFDDYDRESDYFIINGESLEYEDGSSYMVSCAGKFFRLR